MNDTTEDTFPPADPKAEFERQCRELNERRDFVALPGIRFAMHPDDLWFCDDVSDERYFNERFIEPRMEGDTAFLARLVVGWGIVFPLVGVLILAPLFGEYEGIKNGVQRDITDMFWLLLWCTPFFLGSWLFLWLASGAGNKGGGVRFNRRAQLVHVAFNDEVIHLRWRDVRPFMELGSHYGIRLCFPIPYDQHAGKDALWLTRTYRGRPYELRAAFDTIDSATFGRALERIEFIRRYMEHGLEAIQPHPEAVAAGRVRKPSGFVADNRSRLRKAFSLSHWAYMLALGPWVDRWIQRKADAYQWPEEVERLCAPDADLSGYDTTPVKSRTDVYYVYRGMDQGIVFVDANGKPVHGLRR